MYAGTCPGWLRVIRLRIFCFSIRIVKLGICKRCICASKRVVHERT